MNLIAHAFDLHIHSAPDILKRKIDDTGLCQRMIDSGMDGYVIKSHYINTAERAEVLRTVYPGCNVVGSLCLNNAVGGLNVAAVYVGIQAGIRILWFPTSDAKHEVDELFGEAAANAGKKVPMWGKILMDMRARDIPCPGVTLFDDFGRLRCEVMDILKLAAENDLCIATGHISHDEAFSLIRAGHDMGVKRMLLTHATFPATFYSVEEQREFVRLGAMIEHCYTTYSTGKVDFEVIAAQIRAIGPEHVVISTDLGQPTNLYPDEGMLRFSEDLVRAGFTPDEVMLMNGTNPRTLIGL